MENGLILQDVSRHQIGFLFERRLVGGRAGASVAWGEEW